MGRFVYPTKGSPEAFAWAAKMQAARKRKKVQIRSAGLRTEKKFFGPRGVFAKAGHREHVANAPQKFYRGVEKNPKGDYTGVLKLPSYIDRAVAFVLHDGPGVLDWEWDRRMSPENKKHFHDFLVSIHHPLIAQGMTPEQRFKRFVTDYVMPRIEKNPASFKRNIVRVCMYCKKPYGEKEPLADKSETHGICDVCLAKINTKKNPRTRTIPPPRLRHRQNPLAVFGLANPPKRVNAEIKGIVYSRCLEIRAEKTKYKPGLYKHPFSRSSGVQILALDNGDLLVHSTRGVNLWEPA